MPSHALASLALSLAASSALANNVTLPRFPAVSPDGAEVAFAWRGDVWRAPVTGGPARRLTADPHDDAYPTWSPDGSRIAFTSDRVGGGNLFTMTRDGGDVRQVTTTDAFLQLSQWAADDRLYVSARLEPDAFPGGRSYGVPASGGDATRAIDAYGTTPAVSPDGTKVLFVRGGASWSRRGYRGPDNRDVWLFDRATGAYTRLTTHDGNDGRPRWVDDGTFVYASDREDGTLNLYLARVGDGVGLATTRLTDARGTDVEDFSLSGDGKTLVYAQWDRLYRLDLSQPGGGATPIELQAAADDAAPRVEYRNIERAVSDVALSPDGKTLAAVAFGQVWVRGTEARAPTRLVDARFARARDVAWSPDGAILYFSSDADGVEKIYMATAELSRGEVKQAATRPVATTRATTTTTSRGTGLQPVSAATRPEDHGLRTHATSGPATTQSAPDVQPATRPEHGLVAHATTEPSPVVQPTSGPATTQSSWHGLPARDGSPSTQSTSRSTTSTSRSTTTRSSTTRATQPAAPYVNRWPDALTFRVEPLVASGQRDTAPSPSPDGKSLAFQRGNGQLWVRDLASGRERILLDGWSEALEWRWSGDAKLIAFVTEDRNNNRDVFVVPADGSRAAVNVSKHPDNDFSPRFSADGKLLYFLSQRAENESDVYRVTLDPAIDALGGPDLDAYYKDAAEAAKKRERPKPSTTRPSTRASTTQPVSRATTRRAADPLDDAYLRVKKLTSLPGDEFDLEVTPAGDRGIFTARAGAGRAVFAIDRDQSEPRRIQNEVSIRAMNFEGDRAVVVAENRAALMNVATGELYYTDVAGRFGVARAALVAQLFAEAARTIAATYYDSTLNGLDWPATARRYASLVGGGATPGEFEHVANRLLGELNGSHLGLDMPATPNEHAITVGRLGARLTRVGEGYRVDEVFAGGPASRGPMRLIAGDVIVAVEGQPFDAARTLDALMVNRVGLETLVRVRRGGEARDLLVTPIPFSDRTGKLDEATLAYDAWRDANARKVAEISKGRLGYLHIRAMNQPSLEAFERDLFAAADGKEGLVIDVRNNGGGWTTDRLLASIAAPVHAYVRPRGFAGEARGAYPQDRLFIQRYTLPIDMLCNEKSYSNAEIVAHAFKTLRRGTLVGQQTAGGVISTGETTLLDGTKLRLPTRGWFLPDGTNMELNGARPDLIVPQTPAAEAAGDDAQLRAAAENLLSRIDEAKGR